MSSRNRKTGPDVKPPTIKKPKVEPGTLPEGRIPVFDFKDRMRGHVGPLATSVSVARFIGQHGAKLGRRDGKPAWIGPEPPPKPKPKPPVPGVKEPAKEPADESHKVEISVKQAMGSASKEKPGKPETRARPKR